MIIADPEQFIAKAKVIIYISTFIELYKQKNYKQVYEIYRIVEFESWHKSIAQNPCILNTYYIIETLLILCSVYVIPKYHKKIIFYVNNYIN